MDDEKACIVLNTCPNMAVAQSMGSQLVESGLAACVNIIPGIVSIYRWQGEVQKDEEVLLVIKSSTASYSMLEAAIKKDHPYELPEIVCVSIETGLPEYLAWISENTK